MSMYFIFTIHNIKIYKSYRHLHFHRRETLPRSQLREEYRQTAEIPQHTGSTLHTASDHNNHINTVGNGHVNHTMVDREPNHVCDSSIEEISINLTPEVIDDRSYTSSIDRSTTKQNGIAFHSDVGSGHVDQDDHINL